MAEFTENSNNNVPKIVFIVPYRNRPQHKFFFSNYLNSIMNTSTNANITNTSSNYEI